MVMGSVQASILAAALLAVGGCSSPPALDLTGEIVNGRYVDPGRRYSLRVPVSIRNNPSIHDQWFEGAGHVAFGAYFGGHFRLSWSQVPGPPGSGLLEDTDLRFAEVRERCMARIQPLHQDAQLTHQETLRWRERDADFFMVLLPKAGQNERRRTYVLFLSFLEGDTLYVLDALWTPSNRWLNLPLIKAREHILEFADRLAFEDPLLRPAGKLSSL